MLLMIMEMTSKLMHQMLRRSSCQRHSDCWDSYGNRLSLKIVAGSARVTVGIIMVKGIATKHALFQACLQMLANA